MRVITTIVSVMLILAAAGSARGEDHPVPSQSGTAVDYLQPKLLTGTIFDPTDLQKVLFRFRRTTTNSGSQVIVIREYTKADGALAARERVVYEASRLISYELEEFQSGDSAGVTVKPDSRGAHEPQLSFSYTHEKSTLQNHEKLQPDTLINDMVAPFITTHWDELMRGDTVKFRMIAPTRAETVGCKLVKESESTLRGTPVVTIRMEATSFVIAQFVDPLHFTLEKESPHRILQYSGRTTPEIQRKGHWSELDAVTIFDWK